jgi:hypothetical protein
MFVSEVLLLSREFMRFLKRISLLLLSSLFCNKSYGGMIYIILQYNIYIFILIFQILKECLAIIANFLRLLKELLQLCDLAFKQFKVDFLSFAWVARRFSVPGQFLIVFFIFNSMIGIIKKNLLKASANPLLHHLGSIIIALPPAPPSAPRRSGGCPSELCSAS